MVDSLITFEENENIYASETNQNNQFLLSKISDNAAQLTTYLEGEVSSIQSNVASVQATLQGNIDNVSNTVNTLNANVYTDLAANLSAGVSVSTGYTTTKSGWLYVYHKNVSDGQNVTVNIDGKTVFMSGDSGTWSANLVASGFIFVGKGQKITFTGTGTNTLTFYPCKGGK